jgi:hypothetical protein
MADTDIDILQLWESLQQGSNYATDNIHGTAPSPISVIDMTDVYNDGGTEFNFLSDIYNDDCDVFVVMMPEPGTDGKEIAIATPHPSPAFFTPIKTGASFQKGHPQTNAAPSGRFPNFCGPPPHCDYCGPSPQCIPSK